MIKQIILLAAVFFVYESYGQKLSIELSIEWKHEESDTYSKLNFNNVPFLKIRYNNLTSDSIFLPKVYKSTSFMPLFVSGALMGKCKYKSNVFDEIYFPSINRNVFIGGMPPNNIQWEVLPDSIDRHSEHEAREINQTLSVIYEAIFPVDKNLTVGYEHMLDIKGTHIFGELKEDFVFLLSYSNHVEYYNLSGFKVI